MFLNFCSEVKVEFVGNLETLTTTEKCRPVIVTCVAPIAMVTTGYIVRVKKNLNVTEFTT